MRGVIRGVMRGVMQGVMRGVMLGVHCPYRPSVVQGGSETYGSPVMGSHDDALGDSHPGMREVRVLGGFRLPQSLQLPPI